MQMQCLGSSSGGNCYLLRARHEALVLEAGIPLTEVKKAVSWQIKGLVGCLVSHQHLDHAKFIGQYLQNGIKVLALEDVFSALGLGGNVFAREALPNHGYVMGGFKVYTLPVDHDVPCLGFVIDHAEMGRTLFITDTMMLRYRIPRLNHIMIECNYSDQVLDESIAAGETPSAMRQRLLQTHMELQTAKGVLMANDLADVNEVVLLHLSSRHSDESLFKAEVEAACGKQTHIAKAGLTLDFAQMPY